MKLYIFPTPLIAICTLVHDSGWAERGQPDIHPSGRAGQSFNIPPNTPNGNGCQLTIEAFRMVSLLQRGMLMLHEDQAYILADDFLLTPEKVCPEPIPVPPTPIPTNEQPQDTTLRLSKNADLQTKEGCGKYVEACVTELRRVNLGSWQHIPKTGAQNQYNKHAVDAMNLNFPIVIDDVMTKSGVYDIIFNSESPEAKPVFNWVGPPVTNGYYPA